MKWPDWPVRGRESEVDRCLDLLRSGAQLVSLVGPGGIGKTYVARGLYAALKGDAVPCHWVDVHELPVEDAIATVEGFLTGPGPTPAPSSGLPAVVVVDGSPLRDDLAEVVHALRGLGSPALVVTSRMPLALPEEVVLPTIGLPVSPAVMVTPDSAPSELPDQPAVQLMVDRARAVDPTFEPDEEEVLVLTAMARELDGTPLALHLAGLRCGVITATTLSRELESGLQVLGTDDAAASPWLESLHAALAPTIDRLTADERTVLSTIAHLEGGCSLDVLGMSSTAKALGLAGPAINAVTTLVAQGLVESRAGRVPKTTRFYARALLRELVPSTTANDQPAHRSILWALARQATHESGIHGPGWLARSALWFEDEYENLLQALAEHINAPDPDTVPELLDALYRYWMYRGLFDQGLAIVERFDPDQFSTRGRALYLQTAGGLRGHVESLTNVRAELAESVQLWREAGDQRGLATALTRLASSLLETDGFEPCRDALNEAMTLYASLGDKWMHARVLAMLGAAAASDPSEAAYARTCLEAGASEMRNLGDPGAASLPMQQLGRLLIEEGDYEQAQSVLEHGMRQIREVDQVQVSAYLNLLGVVDASMGRHASAASRYLESLRIAVRLGLKSRAVWCLEGLAVTLGDLDERPLAAAAAACAQVIREDLGLEDWWMETCCPKRPGPHLPDSMGSAARLALIEGEVWPPTMVLREAPRRLAELAESAAGGVPRVRSSRPDGLTARECEILALLAQGMTSRDVARNLVISIDTVGRHITNIYRKIGARGRADATAYALRMGIAAAPKDG